MTENQRFRLSPSTRRDFLKTTTRVAAGTALAANLGLLSNVHAAGSDLLKVGLIGCGGRGTGAVENCLSAAPNMELIAMGDAFKDRLDASRNRLRDIASTSDTIKKLGNRVNVPDDRSFVGLDAYERVIGSGVDYVILATPPGFRPTHLQAATAAGKHIFTEKPAGVDPAGIRKVLAAFEEAKKKNLCIVAGTQRRHQAGYIATIEELHNGAVGEITSGRCYWNQGGMWHRDRDQGMTDLEWQIRNWQYFVWLGGDHIVEQHVHNLDVINWVLGTHPINAVAMGGRQVRTDPRYGHIYDHFAVDYEYPNGVHVLSMCRQIDGCENNVSEAVVGAKGSCMVSHYTINGKRVVPRAPENDPYVQEHADLIAAIRSGKPINELENVAHSTLTGIMGRMSAYSGKAISWDRALSSALDTLPRQLSWDMSLPVPPVATPGKTPLL